MRHQIFNVPEFVGRETRTRRQSGYRRRWKRYLDVAGVAILSPVAIPLVGALWIAASADGKNGFYRQERIGRNGQPFQIWKIRTMVADADARLAAHLALDPDAQAEWTQTRKLRHDPRVTRLGRVLRKLSLDELPQLWNVLKGDMSLIGPRPVPKGEVVAYIGAERAYYTLRPGITGMWQVSGRNDVTYGERIRLDTYYVAHLSLKLDLQILWKTIGAVLRRTGV